MTHSEQIGELAAALAKAQAEMEGATKGGINPHFRSKYADLASVRDACIPALAKAGIAVVQSPEVSGAVVSVETLLLHTSGQWVKGLLSCTAKDDGPQSIGSAITYLRRYSLLSFAGIAPEDDDGNAAQGHKAPEAARTAPDPVPAGYDDWLTDLRAAGEADGIQGLEKAWKASKIEFRAYLQRTNSQGWEAMKRVAKRLSEDRERVSK